MKFDPPHSPTKSIDKTPMSEIDTTRTILQVPSLTSTTGTLDSKCEEKKQEDEDHYRSDQHHIGRGIPYSPVRVRSGRGAARSVRSSTPPVKNETPRPRFFVSNRGRGKPSLPHRSVSVPTESTFAPTFVSHPYEASLKRQRSMEGQPAPQV
jgi:hypothetical protein